MSKPLLSYYAVHPHPDLADGIAVNCKGYFFFKQSSLKHPFLTHIMPRTAMHMAAEKGHTSTVEFLADKFRASVFDRTKDGSTLMHIAALNGHPETAMVS